MIMEGNMETIQVVVADDNVQLRDMVAEYLGQQNGMQVVGVASDGIEAIRLIQEKEPDVLVCDMIMPKMDGFGVLEKLQKMKSENIARKNQYIYMERKFVVMKQVLDGIIRKNIQLIKKLIMILKK